MLLEMAFLSHRDALLYISQCHIIIQHLADWWVVVFLWFLSAYSGHKLSSLHIKKCSFHVTLPYKN